MKLDLLTNATVVDDAMRFVSDHNNNNNKKKLISEGENMKNLKNMIMIMIMRIVNQKRNKK